LEGKSASRENSRPEKAGSYAMERTTLSLQRRSFDDVVASVVMLNFA
jgi:hypothetical protein